MTDSIPEKRITQQTDGFQRRPSMTKDATGNYQYHFSSDHVLIWGRRGVMPQELVDTFFDQLKKNHEKHLKIKEFKEKNPEATHDDLMKFLGIPRILSKEESDQVLKDGQMSIKFHEFLVGNWGILLSSLEEEERSLRLFENVENEDSIGIVRQITDSMVYLNKLLDGSVLNNTYDNLYEAKAEIKNSKEEVISLIFSFTANSKEEAENTLENYKKMMIGKGLKIWMAHWGLANEYGRTEFSCPMTEVMKLISEEDREAHFSVKEKQEHWAITKMLGMTKVVREYSVRKKGTGKIVIQWIEQPLLEILGGEREAEDGDKYPQLIAVRVLASHVNMKGFVPAIFHKATYRLPPTTAFLAFAIQNRASQRDRGHTKLSFDWKFLFAYGGVEGTAKSNPRKAKADTRKKMDQIKDEDIISSWDERSDGMEVMPTPQSAHHPRKAHEKDTQKS
jgi:hypothetical protein